MTKNCTFAEGRHLKPTDSYASKRGEGPQKEDIARRKKRYEKSALVYALLGTAASGFHIAIAIKEMHVPIRTVEKGKAVELQMGTEHGIAMYQHWTGTRKEWRYSY